MMSSGARAFSAVVALAVHVRHRSPSRVWRSKMTLLASDAGHPLLYISMICQFFALAIRCSAPGRCSAWGAAPDRQGEELADHRDVQQRVSGVRCQERHL